MPPVDMSLSPHLDVKGVSIDGIHQHRPPYPPSKAIVLIFTDEMVDSTTNQSDHGRVRSLLLHDEN